MFTIKLPIQNKEVITKHLDYIKQYNHVLRFAYNRIQDDNELKAKDINKIIKEKMNNINLLDVSIIECATIEAFGMKDKPNVIFGGKKLFEQRCKGKITNEEWKIKRLVPMMLIGRKSDPFGNRKSKLNVIDNNQIIIKLNKNTHFTINLPKLSKNIKKDLYKIQELCENKEAYFTIKFDLDYVYIMIEETFLQDKEYTPQVKENRVMGIDLNPNYIAISITDYNKEDDSYDVIFKSIFDFKDINNLEHNKYKTNKRKYEVLQCCKRIINYAKGYNVEVISIEQLNMPGKDNKKGKRFNKLVNNYWIRRALIDNLKKRCNINKIKLIEVYPHYTSFIGQINHPDDYDSVGASIEVGRRGYLFNRMYKKKDKKVGDIMFPVFDLKDLDDRWKKTLSSAVLVDGWKQLYNYITKQIVLSYRFLFTREDFSGVSFRLFGGRSLLYEHIY